MQEGQFARVLYIHRACQLYCTSRQFALSQQSKLRVSQRWWSKASADRCSNSSIAGACFVRDMAALALHRGQPNKTRRRGRCGHSCRSRRIETSARQTSHSLVGLKSPSSLEMASPSVDAAHFRGRVIEPRSRNGVCTDPESLLEIERRICQRK